MIRSTADAYLGPEDASDEAWAEWHEAMLLERARAVANARIDPGALDVDETSFRQFFLFMYDARIWDGAWRARPMLEGLRRMFGRIDSVLLWHAYPRVGFDLRTQFDFYRDMPGGLEGLRRDVVDVFHAEGVRVFVDYNPWAAGGYDELAAVVSALGADGVMLDTLTDAPEALARAVGPGVVLAPELRPNVEDLVRLRQSWAQWSDIGKGPSIPKHPWIVPRHRQFTIRRWDTSRRDDIVYSFFAGQGLLLWDNVFGTWNPYGRDDRRLIAETAAIFDRYGRLFGAGTWTPLVPTGAAGLDANRWVEGDRSIMTFRNRRDEALEVRAADDGGVFWGGSRRVRRGDTFVVPPRGTQALVQDTAGALEDAFAHFEALSKRADVDEPEYDERTPRPRPAVRVVRDAPTAPASMIAVPGGRFTMHVRHERRECGCLPDGADDTVMWGWFYRDPIEHRVELTMAPFALRRTAVTNEEFVAFVRASGYRPADSERFLAHLARRADGTWELSVEQAGLPVTHVSLDDARAFAAFHGERLPTEAEWQWAAEGAGAGHRFPWGDEPRTFGPELRAAHDLATATPQGILGLSGNAWELTDSEHDDGHTRFVMLRGGVHLPPDASEWVVPRGPRPNDFHAKYLLLSAGVDRSATVSFRTAVGLPSAP